MKIYTKSGDKGETSLFSGRRVPKYNLRIESYGTVDELNSYIGLVRDFAIDEKCKETLIFIQKKLFSVGSVLASEEKPSTKYIPYVLELDIETLEKEIDRLTEELPPLRNFVLPGGHQAVSYCHVARCVCRRAERLCVKLSEHETVNQLIVIFINRLSDYLFTLARKMAKDYNVIETPWIPGE